MEAAPDGVDPNTIGHRLAAQPGVAEVHDLHIWEVTSGFNAVSAHIVVEAGHDCHEVRRQLSRLLPTSLTCGTRPFRWSTRGLATAVADRGRGRAEALEWPHERD